MQPIPSNDVVELIWRDLHAADFNFNSAFKLQLLDKKFIFAEKILRIIPGKRLVISGIWQDKPVVAKLFFDTHRAKQHWQKEITGAKKLHENNIPTPQLLHEVMSVDRRAYVLIFEHIAESEDLASIWKNRPTIAAVLPILQQAITELATQHVLGIMQHDLHLKNFLLADNKIYTLDGAQIEVTAPLLSRTLSMENLALFFAQLGTGVAALQKELFLFYAKLRGWRLKTEDFYELFYLIQKRNDKRWRQFSKKIFRNCTDFCRLKFSAFDVMYDRQYTSETLLNFLREPDAIFNHPQTKILKAGRSATVAKIQIDQHVFVVKRYNLKNIWHRLRRALRNTRAHNAWQAAHKLCLFGIATAKPVAFIENNYLGFKGTSYYVTEYIAGPHAGEYFQKYQVDENQSKRMVRQIALLLKNIAQLEMTHGDLKITNILINNNDQPVLIDLDGTVEHLSLSGLRNTLQHEIKRFLKNFDQQLDLKDKFKIALTEDDIHIHITSQDAKCNGYILGDSHERITS